MGKDRRIIFLLAAMLVFTVELWTQRLKEVPPDALKRGDQAPPLAFKLMVQGPHLADVNWQTLHGNVVILDFWGTWCAPCVAGIPHLNQLASHYKKEPVQFIAVGHENPKKVEWFLQKYPIDGWVALDLDLSVYKSYSAFGIPHAVVVDQNGRVAAVLNPKDLTEQVIDAVLAGRVPTYPPLTADAYWEPETAAQYFSKIGQEEPPAHSERD